MYKLNVILIKIIVEFNEYNKYILKFILQNKGLYIG